MYCVRLTKTCHGTCMLLLFCWFWLLLLPSFVSRFGQKRLLNDQMRKKYIYIKQTILWYFLLLWSNITHAVIIFQSYLPSIDYSNILWEWLQNSDVNALMYICQLDVCVCTLQVPLTCWRVRRRTCLRWLRPGTSSSLYTPWAWSRETALCVDFTWGTWTLRPSSSLRPWQPLWTCTERGRSSPELTPPTT